MDNDPIQILLADDDENDRLFFSEAFAELEINTVVQIVNDGVQLMKWLNTENIHLPHILFLDLNMPRKNGLECLKEIKSNEKLKDIFVSIYSTSNNEKDIEEAFLMGANVYIAKPYDFKALVRVLEKAVMTASHYEDQSMNRANFLMRV